MLVVSVRVPSIPRRTRSSIAARNAASVLPEPVGAAIRACRPDWIAGQARVCADVGAGKALLNQRATAGWKFWSGMTVIVSPQHLNRGSGEFCAWAAEDAMAAVSRHLRRLRGKCDSGAGLQARAACKS